MRVRAARGGASAQKRLLESLRALQGEGLLPDDLPAGEILPGEAGDAQLQLMHAIAQVSRQEASQALARKLLARRVIRAPFDGVVMARSMMSGETIAASPPGPPLFVVGTDPRSLRLRVDVEEVHVARIHPSPAGFTVPARPGRSFSATVRGVSRAVAPGDRGAPRFQVVLDIDNPSGVLEPGMEAIVELPMSSPDQALRAPVAALDPGAGGAPALWTLDAAGRPSRVPVEIGVSDGRFVEIRAPALQLDTLALVGEWP